jgi:hypothetical protein
MAEKIVSERHPELFHYTTVAAFKQINKSRQLWATHYADMNDSSELARFRQQVIKHTSRFIPEILQNCLPSDAPSMPAEQKGELESKIYRESIALVERLHQKTFGECGLPETFICSFCAHPTQLPAVQHGLLSQWRGYGAGGGVAIVLDTRGIECQMAREQARFVHRINKIADVTYDDNSNLKETPEFRRSLTTFQICFANTSSA